MPTPRNYARSVASRVTAKVFWSGRSQAIRLPQQFRMSVREVIIRKMKNGLYLEPLTPHVDANGWPENFWKLFEQNADGLDVGRPEQAHERPYPLGRKR